MNMHTLNPADSYDFLPLGNKLYILRGEVTSALQRRYDAAASTKNASALKAVSAEIVQLYPAEVIKADQLPELAKRHSEFDAFMLKAAGETHLARLRAGPDHVTQPSEATLAAFRAAPLSKNVKPLAAGVALVTQAGEMLFVRNATGEREWTLPLDLIYPSERAAQTIVRAAWEQLGYKLPPGDRREIITTDGDEPLSTWLQRIGEAKFIPRLTGQHSEHRWSPPDAPPQPLHPALRTVMPTLYSEITQFTMR